MIWTIVGMLAAFALAWKLHPGDRTVVVEEKDNNGEWFATVQATDDPNVYRGIYETVSGRRYEYEGRGISNTLEGLANEMNRL